MQLLLNTVYRISGTVMYIGFNLEVFLHAIKSPPIYLFKEGTAEVKAVKPIPQTYVFQIMFVVKSLMSAKFITPTVSTINNQKPGPSNTIIHH